MLKKTTFLISALCMLILANVLMMSYASPAFRPTAEGFASLLQDEEEGYANKGKAKKSSAACQKAKKTFDKAQKNVAKKCGSPRRKSPPGRKSPPRRKSPPGRKSPPRPNYKKRKDGFANYTPGGAKDAYQPMGAFDGVKLPTGNKSSWRHTSPNEALAGNYPKFEVGPDNLFMFKDNQCKPSCCGASYACDGGCVCTTPEQRNFINMRGGNRTAPDAGV